MMNTTARIVSVSSVVLLLATLQAPAWSVVFGPETARELRRQRAERNLKANERNLERKARDAVMPEIDAMVLEDYTRMLNYIGDPAREGRAPGSQGIEDAAVFIENEFESVGLVPAFDLVELAADDSEAITPNATFRQPMSMGSSLSAATQMLSINGNELIADEDFSAVAFSGSTSASGEVVFAGYAVVSGPNGYMGFGPNENFDGKIAMCMKYEPMDANGNSKWNDDGWSHHARLTYKISALERRGAEAVLIVSPDFANDPAAGNLDTMASTSPPPSMRINRGGPKYDIPVLSISPEAAQMILDRDGGRHTLESLAKVANETGIVQEIDGARVELEVEIAETETYTDNVGAILPGRGELADEYIVIGGHYDHVGYGLFGSRGGRGQLHPGADDNASGTSGVILAAKELSERYKKYDESDNVRSVLFLLFTAEESGLNGSKFYVNNPIADLLDHKLMLNMDMIGTLESDPLEIGGIKSSRQLEELITDHLVASGMVYNTETSVGDGRSDHASFDDKRIPNMFFFTGLHDQYHTPQDTLDIVDPSGAVRIAQVVTEIAYDAATTGVELIHYSRSNVADTRRQKKEEEENPTPKVRIGIIPSDTAAGGLFVERVFDGTSASGAGLQAGDRITHWGDMEISSVEDWAPVLLEHEPGEVVKLKVVRDGETVEIDMTLKGTE